MFEIDFGKPDVVVGIDLGTTNSLVAVMEPTGPRVIEGPGGQRLVPSVVSVAESGEILVGEAARELLISHPERSVYSAKRLMGRGVADVQEELKIFPFRIAEGSEAVIRMQIADRQFTPPEIGAFVLRT